MSAFNNYQKDGICEGIAEYIADQKELNPNIPVSEIIRDLMEVISYGIQFGIAKIENKQNGEK